MKIFFKYEMILNIFKKEMIEEIKLYEVKNTIKWKN